MNPRAILQDIQRTTAQGAAAISENAHLITAAAAFGIIAVLFLYHPTPKQRRR